eukprot:Blabericola_migrator_1__1321@NODE_1343_length_4758_cov_149_423151_g901_i0_p4_GENE_NODE_1343_length_4758_cov_149_423151_g901_i0NODE_1343_length_4758_cov_149_423151_g901_i0_p4_ORF_typecomplete_len156_score9_22TAT_signal/PF10518_9/88TAT_signal/PF10518_9/8_1_NODE_1343_length_4758_cov_149_423151_g901_i036024069
MSRCGHASISAQVSLYCPKSGTHIRRNFLGTHIRRNFLKLMRCFILPVTLAASQSFLQAIPEFQDNNAEISTPIIPAHLLLPPTQAPTATQRHSQGLLLDVINDALRLIVGLRLERPADDDRTPLFQLPDILKQLPLPPLPSLPLAPLPPIPPFL